MGFQDYADFCVLLEQVSSQIDRRLSGDTLFGKLSWVFIELFGEGNFQEFLEEHKRVPVVIFSGVFPNGFIPMPVFVPTISEITAQSEKEYEELKSLKKLLYVELDRLKDLFTATKQEFKKSASAVFSKSGQRIHVSISRLDGTALKGMIFSTSESKFATDLWFFMRVKNEFLKKYDLEKILHYMFESGLGAKKSSGKGHFLVKKISDTQVLEPEGKENAFLSLSRWIPSQTDPSNGYFKIYSKRPRIGGIFSEMGIFQKKPILMIEEGSWFYVNELKPYFGKTVESIQLPIYGLNENLVQSCYCLPLYFSAPPEGD